MLGRRGTNKIRVIVSDADGDDGLPYHPRGQYQLSTIQTDRRVAWRGILSISCIDGWVRTCIQCACMDGLWNCLSKRKRCQCVLGAELKDVGPQVAWRQQHREGEEKQKLKRSGVRGGDGKGGS
jgi:hypothetical protein